MNAFARLGLEPDADEAQIRRAYARELRQARPDENPAAFQALNEAYRQCLDYAAWRASGGEDYADDDWDDDDQEAQAGAEPSPAEALALRLTPEALSAALAMDRPLADASHAQDGATTAEAGDDARAEIRLDHHAFVAELFEVSSVGSDSDVYRWLQSHPAFYAVGAREMLAPQVLDALLAAPELPPRHLAAVLHFFHLDEVGAAHDWLWPRIAELQQRARLTSEHTAAANRLFGQAKAIDEDDGSRFPFWPIWVCIMFVLALVRCGSFPGG
ncbi:J domain-containing protein [Lysobacter silvisoli]|uniref:J domain-containing protein n=1 Tax=Lysobacter silvisoli TaxID=2293254 RepID=A0A371K2H5_9GAMM|nr:J domain-containing protein [Lysobacter silvisoli]RDZ28129.1 J domain-containing protein [Lysobacter silvisoli]